jgi:hypothetical protein
VIEMGSPNLNRFLVLLVVFVLVMSFVIGVLPSGR